MNNAFIEFACGCHMVAQQRGPDGISLQTHFCETVECTREMKWHVNDVLTQIREGATG